MEEAVRVRAGRIIVALAVGVLSFGGAHPSFAKDKPKSPPSSSAKEKAPPAEAVNACGCYRDAKGGCVCTDKKGKCECPGDCEPVGCDEKRDKEMEREMAAEIKRAQDEEKKRQAEKEAQEARENGAAAAPDAGETPPPMAAKPKKSPRKDVTGKGDAKAERK